ncbi:hypothetical protein XM38_002590 [Halomicronema hongdechloris C2206]|uniref:PEP-CTERM protein-sorting domain-containing protein n=1 Tax=Halomicronema hongdechloris C2206 TaxID=1641165 RepID=A0A1Z3HGB2_9CYAN|nr:PEP-CTERM sorting domain-containing protein [Halomicronema hongdechloris]ASC69332.1 hypothetical protein XM38_002590 [Halomicronema hongdechloris C2206]
MKWASFLPAALMAGGLSVGLTLMAQPAQAFSLFFDATTGSTNNTPTGASGRVDFTFTDLDADTIGIQLDIFNTTDAITGGAGATESKFMGFGFKFQDTSLTDLGLNTDSATFTGSEYFSNLLLKDALTLADDITAVGSNSDISVVGTSAGGGKGKGKGKGGGGSQALSLGGNIDGISLDNFDLVISNKDDFKGSGSPQSALAAGQSSTVAFTLNAVLNQQNERVTASELEDVLTNAFKNGDILAAARFKDVNAGEGSDKLLGEFDPGDAEGDNNDDGATEVPEPSAIFGIAIVAGALIALKRRPAMT